MSIAYMQLTTANHSVRLDGSVPQDVGGSFLAIEKEGVEGWYSTPDLKVTMTERGQSDGAHDVAADAVLYASRTVTVHCLAIGNSRGEVLRQYQQVARLAHQTLTARLVDDESDTYITGYMSLAGQATWNFDFMRFDLTIVAARPERLAWTPYRVQLHAASTGDTGLRYGDNASGLQYPLQYGKRAVDARNVATLLNQGSSRAYPVLTVNGWFDAGVMIDFPGTGCYLRYAQPVGSTPLVLDSRSRTATVGGLDVTRYLSSRGFPVVEPYSSVSAVLLSGGSGWVTCEVRDTYM